MMYISDPTISSVEIRSILTIGSITPLTLQFEATSHSHDAAQLLLPVSGMLVCSGEAGLWLVPPGCAIWMPAGIVHSFTQLGRTDAINALIANHTASDLPKTISVMSISEHLSALLSDQAALPSQGYDEGASAHVVDAFMAELAKATVENLHLPMPRDPRLRNVVASVMADPATRRSRAALAAEAGIAERTLDRGMIKETGLGFARWRQQLAVVVGLQMMADGHAVHVVAANLGYDSPGGFIKMFRRTMGRPPAQYMRALPQPDRCL